MLPGRWLVITRLRTGSEHRFSAMTRYSLMSWDMAGGCLGVGIGHAHKLGNRAVTPGDPRDVAHLRFVQSKKRLSFDTDPGHPRPGCPRVLRCAASQHQPSVFSDVASLGKSASLPCGHDLPPSECVRDTDRCNGSRRLHDPYPIRGGMGACGKCLSRLRIPTLALRTPPVQHCPTP